MKRLLITLLLATTCALQAQDLQILSKTKGLANITEEKAIILPALDLKTLREKSAASKKKTLNFAQPSHYDLNTENAGEWSETQHKGIPYDIWRLKLISPNAYSINLGFTEFSLPKGSHLHFYNDKGKKLMRSLTAADNDVHGQFWTPILQSKNVIIELNIPHAQRDNLKLTLSNINQAFIDITNLSNEIKKLKSGACNVDTACPAAAAWKDQVQSVAAYSIDGTDACSGAAIRSAIANPKPYFLTANHCEVTSANAASVVFYWNYENSTCRPPGSSASGSTGDGSRAIFSSGSIHKVSYGPSDMTLLELDDPFPFEANVFLAGWDRRNIAPSSAVAIHHPSVEEKRISFENDALTISAYEDRAGSGDTHLRIADWDIGTTESGSSGSPLFSPDKRIIGQLNGGDAACGNDDPDWYGRLYTSWQNSTLKNYLDPNDTGIVVLNGVYAASTPSAQSGAISDAVEYTPTDGWYTNTDNAFIRVTNDGYDGIDALQSADIGHNDMDSLSTRITGPGTLIFYWKVSSEKDYDVFAFSLDGREQKRISGEVYWTKVSISIPAGRHTFSWVYAKDFSNSSGNDKAWLDQVVFTPTASGPFFFDSFE